MWFGLGNYYHLQWQACPEESKGHSCTACSLLKLSLQTEEYCDSQCANSVSKIYYFELGTLWFQILILHLITRKNLEQNGEN